MQTKAKEEIPKIHGSKEGVDEDIARGWLQKPPVQVLERCNGFAAAVAAGGSKADLDGSTVTLE